MLSACRSMANSNDVFSDLNGDIVYVLRVPRIIPVYRAALRNSRQFTAEKKAKRQQQRPDCHIDTRNTRTATSSGFCPDASLDALIAIWFRASHARRSMSVDISSASANEFKVRDKAK